MAALAPKPRNRAHFAVRFAAGAMRITAVLVILAAAAGVYGLVNLSQVPNADGLVLHAVAAIVGSVLLAAFAITIALILWGFGDALILLADLDDAQREVQRQLADLVLAQRTARGPFHYEAVAEARAAEEKTGTAKAPEVQALR